MEFTLIDLIRAFGVSVVAGIALAVFYEPVRLFHKIGFSKSTHYFVCDFLFIVISAFVTYLLCIAFLEGRVRLFTVVGEILGFTLFYFTARPVLDRIYNPIIKFSKKIISKLLKITRKVMYNIYTKIIVVFNYIKNKVKSYVWKKKEKKRKSNKKLIKHKRSKNKKEKN